MEICHAQETNRVDGDVANQARGRTRGANMGGPSGSISSRTGAGIVNVKPWGMLSEGTRVETFTTSFSYFASEVRPVEDIKTSQETSGNAQTSVGSNLGSDDYSDLSLDLAQAPSRYSV